MKVSSEMSSNCGVKEAVGVEGSVESIHTHLFQPHSWLADHWKGGGLEYVPHVSNMKTLQNETIHHNQSKGGKGDIMTRE